MRGTELTHGWVRLARAGVLGGSSLALGTAGHVVGGGTLPGVGLLALLGVALGLVAVSLTARRLHFGLLLGLLAVEQAGMHLALHAATTASACTAVAMPGHAMTAGPVTTGTVTTGTVCPTGTAAAPGGWLMLLGHVLALLATAWLLAAGERWLWQVVDRVVRYAAARPTRARRPRLVPAPVRAARSARRRWSVAASRAPPLRTV